MLNKKYLSQENALVNYDYTDIAEGTGIIRFYGYSTTTSAATTYRLGNNLIYSSAVELVGSDVAGDSSWHSSFDVDFDLAPFNTPKDVLGTSYVSFCGRQAYGNPVLKMKYDVNLYHYDGTTETLLATATTQTITSTTGDATQSRKIFAVPLSITTPKHFKIGEILRLNIIGYMYRTADSAGEFATLGLDPMNRDGTYIIPSTDTPPTTTQLIADIAFRMDV